MIFMFFVSALKAFCFDSNHMKHIHPHMNVDGDYIKIFPKRKAAYDSYGKTLIVLYSICQ